MQPLESPAADPFDDAITALLQHNPDPFFVQVGGFDGVSFDPLRRHVVEANLAGLIAEPVPQYYEQLRSLYAGSGRVTTVNCAIAEENGERTIWRFNPEAVTRGLLPPHFGGISSFLMDELLDHSGVLGRSSPNEETRLALKQLVEPVPVRCRTMTSLLSEQGCERVDILQIDTEGYDFVILKLFDFERFRPAVVHYEHQHLKPADAEAAEALLRSHGYRIVRERFDTVALLDAGGVAAGAPRTSGLQRLAAGLQAEGRSEDALLLLEHLASLHPSDVEIARQVVAALSAQGRTLEALERLVAFKAVAPHGDLFAREIQHQAERAADNFNAHVTANELDLAERYAAALAALVPDNIAILNAALSCNEALGRGEAVQRYARALLAQDPGHARARAALGGAEAPEAGPDAECEALLTGDEPAHPLLRLRDIHDMASRILCEPLSDEAAARVERLLAAARGLQVPTEAGSEWEGWERHYRVLLQAVDLPVVLGPTPEPAPADPVEFMTSDGKALSAAKVRATAKRLGAQAVFFAAADASYVELYARWYVLSILKHCDVPFIIVVHVIGGAGALQEAARTVGVSDERLIFAGDRFDAEAVRIRCYDAPPKGEASRPIAHFQSVRFQRLGQLLETVQRPVFVSDIDLLLQRGVADLLERHAEADVVFNENEGSWNAGSRLTANLLLVRPTPAADVFLRFLKAYLERVLAGEEVTRWIDQVALVLARHHLQRRGQSPRIGYFDTATDINNVMYPSYQQNPFRFLSLYHGFDTSSLEAVA